MTCDFFPSPSMRRLMSRLTNSGITDKEQIYVPSLVILVKGSVKDASPPTRDFSPTPEPWVCPEWLLWLKSLDLSPRCCQCHSRVIFGPRWSMPYWQWSVCGDLRRAFADGVCVLITMATTETDEQIQRHKDLFRSGHNMWCEIVLSEWNHNTYLWSNILQCF